MKLKNYRHILTGFEYFLDSLTIYTSCLMAFSLWKWLDQISAIEFIKADQHFSVYLKFFLIVTVVTIAVYRFNGLYRLQKSILNIREMEALFKGTIASLFIILAGVFFYKTMEFARMVVFLSYLLIYINLNVIRYLIYKLNQFLMKHSVGNQNVLIYGGGVVGRRLREKIDQSPKLGYNLIGFIDDNPKLHGKELTDEDDIRKAKVLGSFNDIARIVREHQVDRIFVAMPNVSKEKILKVIELCNKEKCDFKIVPSLYDIMIHKIRLTEVDGIPLISLKQPAYRKSTVFFKRIFDLCFLVLISPFILPLFMILPVLIKLDSPGPVFFKQIRIGFNGRPFHLYKFRTMYVNSDPYQKTPASSKDPRITRVGRWLRRFSIDEFPQVINVFKWEMNVVGPRPEMPFMVDKYNTLQHERLNVRPGITGLWQISEDRRLAIHENMDYDIYYIENQSVLLDVVIIIKTFFSALRGIGAY